LNLFEQEEARNHSIEKKEDKSYQDLELSWHVRTRRSQACRTSHDKAVS
jgi:hypothetical protein